MFDVAIIPEHVAVRAEKWLKSYGGVAVWECKEHNHRIFTAANYLDVPPFREPCQSLKEPEFVIEDPDFLFVKLQNVVKSWKVFINLNGKFRVRESTRAKALKLARSLGSGSWCCIYNNGNSWRYAVCRELYIIPYLEYIKSIHPIKQKRIIFRVKKRRRKN